jgi:competence ComEA-like helix-hairpin-helix protein
MTPSSTQQSSGSPSGNRLGRESRPPSSNGQTIPIALRTISQQLPAGFLAPAAPETLARITINIPVDWVIPQLAIGRITITLADLLPLLPNDVVQRPLPNGNSQYAVVLPLAEIVSALPAELLQHQDQTALDIEAPEFTQFPKLFDDSEKDIIPQQTIRVEEPVAIVELPTPEPIVSTRSFETTPVETVNEEPPAPRPLAPVMARPIPTAEEPLPQVVVAPVPTGEDQITVSLRSLVAVMPDQIFICPRTDLWRRIDLDSRIALPTDLVVPQLKIARVRLPLSVAVGLMPRGILASPLPQISDETIPIALQEIVPQLPPNLFASQSNSSELQEIDFSDSEIPTPFTEKSFTSAPVEAQTPETVQPEFVPAPIAAEATPEPIEMASSALEDESLSIFAEKSAVAEPITIEPTPQVKPVIQTPIAQQVQPVVEVPAPADQQRVEPIAEVASVVTEQSFAFVETPRPIEPITTPVEPVRSAPVAETVAPVVIPAPVIETPTPVAQTPAPVAKAPVNEIVHEVELPEPTAVPVSSTTPTPNSSLARLNSCTMEELARIEGVGAVAAQRIIEFRNTRGGFQSLEELQEINGLSRKAFRTLAGQTKRGLNRLLGVEHNDELTLQEIVRLTSQLQGVAGCILALSDGVFVTGQLPPHLDQETISVFAPELFNKVATYTKELRVGEVTRLSVFTDQQPLSIFRAGDIFLVVLHDNRHFSKALLRRCERISQELAPLCRQRAAV